MVRVKSSTARHKRKKRVLKAAKGHYGFRSRRFRQAVKSVIKAQTYQYRDRKNRKRSFRSLWIVRINAACQENGIKYNRFIEGLDKAKVTVNRKMIADLAVNDPAAFKELVKTAQSGLTTTVKKTAKK